MWFLDLIRMISHPTPEPMDSVFPDFLSKIDLFGKGLFLQHGGQFRKRSCEKAVGA